jgi:hypothetical protein
VPIVSGSGSSGVALVGSSSLIYRYTVSGADKASIDTGVDASLAGSNDWTNADLLVIAITAQTDDAAIFAFFDATINNDTGANYDWYANLINGAALGISSGFGDTRWQVRVHGTTGQAYPATLHFEFPSFTKTTFKKSGGGPANLIDASTANSISGVYSLGNRNTTAITRFKMAAQAAAKFKIGTELIIEKWVAS